MFENVQKRLLELTTLAILLDTTKIKDLIDFDDIKGGSALSDLGIELGLLQRYEDELYSINADRWDALYENLCYQLGI